MVYQSNSRVQSNSDRNIFSFPIILESHMLNHEQVGILIYHQKNSLRAWVPGRDCIPVKEDIAGFDVSMNDWWRAMLMQKL